MQAAVQQRGVCAIVGAGPGIGASVARKFSAEGYSVAILARKMSTLEPLRADLEKRNAKVFAVECNAAEERSVKEAFSKIPPVDVLVYNAGAFRRGTVSTLTPQDLLECLTVGPVGALSCIQQVLPHMESQKKGTILVTGATASLRGSAGFAALATQKFALRALAQSAARELGPKGIHVSHVIIDGAVDIQGRFPEPSNGSRLNPDEVANAYWNLHTQHHTTWTFELDLRPSVEKW